MEEKIDMQGDCTMSKEDCSNSNVFTCKRKLGETLDSKEVVDNTTRYKKARHPWQIKGISFERNIISQEVRITEDDPKQMVGVIKYEEKGILSVNLSDLSDTDHIINHKRDTETSRFIPQNVLKGNSDGPSTSTQDTYSKFNLDICNKSDILESHTHPDNMCVNNVLNKSSDHCFEEESQSSMEHESSNSNNHRERNSMDDINPTLNFQQCVWQKREMGCAIVDNVFNKTLEEMGLSPDPKVNRFATDRLQILQQGIDAAINQQGLFPQHFRSDQMEHSVSSTDNYSSDANTLNQQDHSVKRRQSLEELPTSKTLFPRRLSQPLSGLGMKLKGQERSNIKYQTVDSDSKLVMSEPDTTVDKKWNVGFSHDTDSDTMTSIPDHLSTEDEHIDDISETSHTSDAISQINDYCESVSVEANDLDHGTEANGQVEKTPKPLQGSENLLDLAVSTVIQSQGLSL